MTTVWNEYTVPKKEKKKQKQKQSSTPTHMIHMNTLSTASGTDIADIAVDNVIPQHSHTLTLILFSLSLSLYFFL